MNRRSRRALHGAVVLAAAGTFAAACAPEMPYDTTTTTSTTTTESTTTTTESTTTTSTTTTSTTTTTTLPPPPPLVNPTLLGTYRTGLGNGSGETVGYGDGKLFVTNTAGGGSVDVVNLSDLTRTTRISTAPLLPNSVAVKDGLVAVAVEDVPKTNAGKVLLYGTDGTPKGDVTVGALPDMLTFTPDGNKVLVANEGEPNSYNQVTSVDPEGSVSIVDVSTVRTGGTATVTTAGFAGFNGDIAALRAAGVRIFGPNATVAQDLEPEYIAVSPDGATAWVTLQEANAIAKIDVATATVASITPLGTKDMSLPGNEMDASDQDSNVGNLQSWPVAGLYQPDSVALFVRGGIPYLVTANEGDSRNYTGFNEEIRVNSGSFVLDPTTFPNAAALKQNANLGRLQVTTTSPTSPTGRTRIDMFGTRSFSVWNGDTLAQVFDSGSDLERRTLAALPTVFNASNDNNTPDDRSDNKGPEPEGATVVDVDGRPVAFIGLERIGGVAAYDVSDPAAPRFNSYVNPRNFSLAATDPNNDSGPEVLASVPGSATPSGRPYLLVANEITGSVNVYQL